MRISFFRFRAGTRLWVLLTILVILISSLESRFYTSQNLLNIPLQIAIDGVLACGMTLVVVTGGLDLSIGSVAALSGVLFVITSGYGLVSAGLLAIGAGVLIGILNGFLIARLRLNSLIVTLGAMASVQGAALWLSHGYPLPGPGGDFQMLGGGFLCYIPLPIVCFALIAAAGHLMLRLTQFGRNLYAVGGNREAAQIVQIHVTITQWTAYVICSVLAAFAGILLASRLNSGSPIIGQDSPLQAFVAVVLGGTSLSGGTGGIAQTVLGLVVLGTLSNGLNLMNVPPALQWGVKGSILIFFAALNEVKRIPGWSTVATKEVA